MQGRDCRSRPCDRGLIETQVVPARRADTGAFQDRGFAVRASAGRPGHARARRTHASGLAELLSLLPNSTWPFMREPAATVTVSALMSPTITPLASSSTRCADSMLPSSSPAIVTLRARTSPLKRPAMRMWPAPSILPSMVRSEAISDSLPSLRSTGTARATEATGLNSFGSGSRLSAVSMGLEASTGAGMSRLDADCWLKIAIEYEFRCWGQDWFFETTRAPMGHVVTRRNKARRPRLRATQGSVSHDD